MLSINLCPHIPTPLLVMPVTTLLSPPFPPGNFLQTSSGNSFHVTATVPRTSLSAAISHTPCTHSETCCTASVCPVQSRGQSTTQHQTVARSCDRQSLSLSVYASASSPVSFLYLSDLTTFWLSTKNTASPGSHPVETAHSLPPQETNKAEYLSAPLHHFQTVTVCLSCTKPYFETDPGSVTYSLLATPLHPLKVVTCPFLLFPGHRDPLTIIHSLSYQYSQFLALLPFHLHPLRKITALGLTPPCLSPSTPLGKHWITCLCGTQAA